MATSSKNLTFRCPDELRTKLEEMAKLEQRSLSNLIIKVLTEYSNKEK